MKPSRRFPGWPVVRLGAVAVLLTALVLPVRSQSQDPQNAKQVADIQKQIEALNKQLAELNKAPATPPTTGATTGTLPANWVSTLNWRSIGPANMGGRITAFTVYEADPTTYWVASASGGLVKTVNNGSSFEHQFDHEGTVSIGSRLRYGPVRQKRHLRRHRREQPARSVSYGDGVYKSSDGGKTWKHMGLKQSYQIGKIVVHPTDPNTVYVGAMGRCYGPNEERGIFKSTDGGQTWEKVTVLHRRQDRLHRPCHAPEHAGHPNRRHVGAQARRVRQLPWRGTAPQHLRLRPDRQVQPQGRLCLKTTRSAARTGKSSIRAYRRAPSPQPHRPGLLRARTPNVVFAIVDSERSGTGPAPGNAALPGHRVRKPVADGLKVTTVAANSPAAKAGLKVNDVLVSIDGKALKQNYEMNDALRGKAVNAKVKLKAKSGGEEKDYDVALAAPPPAGGRGGFPGLGQNPIPTAGFRADEVEGGLRVTNVADESPAGKAGLKVGDVITGYEGKIVAVFMDLMRDIATGHRPGDKIKLTVKPRRRKWSIWRSRWARPSYPHLVAVAVAAAAVAAAGAVERTLGHTAAAWAPRDENVQDQQGPTASRPAASSRAQTAAKAGRASTASIRGRCTSASSAWTQPTRNTSGSAAWTSSTAPTAASTSPAGGTSSTPTTTPSGLTRRTAGT